MLGEGQAWAGGRKGPLYKTVLKQNHLGLLPFLSQGEESCREFHHQSTCHLNFTCPSAFSSCCDLLQGVPNSLLFEFTLGIHTVCYSNVQYSMLQTQTT